MSDRRIPRPFDEHADRETDVPWWNRLPARLLRPSDDAPEDDRPVELPWRYPYLCINPTYPLPELEFFAHLYLYVRDYEEEIVRVAAPQPWDQALGRTF
jgi:hypothetical protein